MKSERDQGMKEEKKKRKIGIIYQQNETNKKKQMKIARATQF